MSYYGRGDYYGRGGLLDFAKKALGTVARGAVGFVTGGPVGAIQSIVAPVVRQPSAGGGTGGFTIPQVTVNPMAALPGGDPLFSFGRKRRRRINPGNIKALNRAVRRQDAFVRTVRSSLKHTNYTLVTKGSRSKGRGRGNVFVETGAGGIRA
jgi:hypothetical protein